MTTTHETTIREGGPHESNYVWNCTCGKTGGVASLTRGPADRAADDHRREAPEREEHEAILAQLEETPVTSPAEAQALLQRPDPERTTETMIYLAKVAAGTVDPPHAPAEQELVQTVVTIEVVVDHHEGVVPPTAAQLVEGIGGGMPDEWFTAEEGDPYAIDLRAPADGPVMVDLTRPARWHAKGTVNGGADGWAEPEATILVEFGEHWEDGWYVWDHRPTPTAARGPFVAAHPALVGVKMEPGMILQHHGAWPPADEEPTTD